MEKKDPRLLSVVFILVGLMLMSVIGNGMAYHTRSIYVAPISAGLGIPRSAYSAAFSAMALAVIPITANIGTVKRILRSYRMLILTGFLSGAAGIFLASQAQSLWHFYVYAFFIQMGVNFCSIAPITGVVNNWFEKNRGFFIGLLGAGSSFGGALFSPLTGRWIETFGWRTSFFITACVVAATGVLVFFLVHDHPKGHEPLSRIPERQELKKVKHPPFWKSRSLLFLGIATFFMMFSVQGFQLNASVILLDSGCDLIASSTIVGRMLFVSSLGKIGAGFLNDKLGLKFVRTFLLACAVLGIFSLLFAQSVFAQWCFVILFGIGFSLMMMCLPLHATELFPPERLDRVIGVVSAFGAAGTFLGVPTVNLYYERFGNYTGIAVIGMAFLTISWVFYSLTRSEKEPSPSPSPSHS